MVNNGGRSCFEPDTPVRIITELSQISRDIYYIKSTRADRKSSILVSLGEGHEPFRVHSRRIIDVNFKGAIVLTSLDGISYAACPKCNNWLDLTDVSDQCVCNSCGPIDLCWITKPTKKIKTERLVRSGLQQLEERKVAKTEKQVNIVKIEDLVSINDCELWTKRTPFDHAKIDTRACVLLYVKEPYRKLCFNIYDGQTGKNPIPLQQFLDNDPGNGKATWYNVKDLESARADFVKKGYERITSLVTEEAC